MAKEKPERCPYDSNGSFTISANAKVKKFEGNESCLKELQNETNPIILAQFVWQQH